uniref:probable carotenoid cleavage dioxygenase 4, chloroplastic n=1 Tax=Erigeron canadensis TaxID=72917 RepID=UPI001CB93F84|nr:probable carotenoid cleavage dioxygenase 4, chloroplastic [Erigeron canadensis]
MFSISANIRLHAPTSPPVVLSLQSFAYRVLAKRNNGKKPQTTIRASTGSSNHHEQFKRPTSSVLDTKEPLPTTNIFNAIDPKHVLSGNFSPIDELPPTQCEVIEGTLPSCLDGAYFRNGPNPQYVPHGPYHLFDGDGMLHAIRISKGKATLCSRYVKTHKYNAEKDAGFPIVPFFFTGFDSLGSLIAYMVVIVVRYLKGKFDPNKKGFGLANTNLALFGNKLFALWESDLPYAIKINPDGDIVTLGREDFDGKLLMSMTAHPKYDPMTKETFAFRYGPVSPFLTYFWFNERGEKQPDVPIFSTKSPTFFHDFAITKNYAIFPENQITMHMKQTDIGWSLISADMDKVPRIGVMPRYAENELAIRWFKVPGLNIVHAVNAWEEDVAEESVVLIASNILSIEHALGRTDLIHGSLEKVRIDLKTGMVSRHTLSSRNLEFGVINSAYVAAKNRYVYCAVGDPMPKFSGVVKLDVSLSEVDRQECIVASRIFGPGCFGGEPFFVAKEPDNPNADEDDGYIVSYVHNENNDESCFLVMDAKSMTLEIVATVKLPRRVPYGFHGLFVTENNLNKL